MPEPLVAVRGLTVQFPRRDVASPVDVDLNVAAGERVLVLGPSGSGKSTLLRALAGVVPHSIDADVEGRVTVAGREVSGVPVARLADDVGLLGQDPASSVALPRVDDEVAFGLENAAVPPAEIGPAVREALASVGAAHLAERQTRTLSGGELQRVALAAVLARRPRLLLLDEPTAMLDPASAAAVQRLTLGALSSGGGPPPAVLVVDHHLQDAATLPPRVVVLDAAGRVAADGPTASVLADRGAELAAGGSWVPLETEVALAVGQAPGSGIGLDGAAPRLRALAYA
ncbi:MAG: energy-coupling factor ABC transporter ATP-binding protein, partial [Actinomycetota bacterium]